MQNRIRSTCEGAGTQLKLDVVNEQNEATMRQLLPGGLVWSARRNCEGPGLWRGLVASSIVLALTAGCIPDLKHDTDGSGSTSGNAGRNSGKATTSVGGAKSSSSGGASSQKKTTDATSPGGATGTGSGANLGGAAATASGGAAVGGEPFASNGGAGALGGTPGTDSPAVGSGGSTSGPVTTGGGSGAIGNGGASVTPATTGGAGTTVGPGGSTGGAPTTTKTGTGGGCSAGSLQCANNVPQLCSSSGQWESQAACSGEKPTCKEGKCVCTAGTKQCGSDGVTVQICGQSGAWQDQSTCSGANPYCYGAGSCVVCKEGNKTCSGKTPQICTAGTWKAQTACSGYCNGQGLCGDCSADSKRCNGNTPQECSAAGKWQNQEELCSGTKPVCIGDGVCGCPNKGGPTMVGLPLGFCIDSTEVTQGQYAVWLNTNPSTAGQISDCSWNTTFAPDSDWQSWTTNQPNKPLGLADWCDAYAYCKAVGKRMCGKISGGSNEVWNYTNTGYSQWFASCTSNGANDYPYGDTYNGSLCFTSDTSGVERIAGTLIGCQSSVAGYRGVYDMSASVFEWEDSCDGSGQSALCRVRGGQEFGTGDGSGVRCDDDNSSRRDTLGWPAYGIRCCAP